MNKNIIMSAVAIALVAGGLGFYAGNRYGQSKAMISGRGTGAFANLSPEERAARFQQSGAGQRTMRTVANFVAGEIAAKDTESLTLKLRDGGSRIIFFSANTSLSKTASGTQSELIVGKQITAEGTANQDGSLSAKSIQMQ